METIAQPPLTGAQAARQAPCSHCCAALPGEPCLSAAGTAGVHLARYAAARKAGLITAAAFAAAVAAAGDVFTGATVIRDGAR